MKARVGFRSMFRWSSLYLSWLVIALALISVASADPLTRQQLLDMKAAGITEKVIINAVIANGIAFTPDADAIIALHKAGFSNDSLDALTRTRNSSTQTATPTATATPAAQTRTGGASPTQFSALEKPPAQAQVDPCVAWQQEYERLYKEDEAITTACDQLASNKSGAHAHDTFAEDCPIANCSARKRLINFQNPNKCPNPHSDIVFTDNCEPYDGYGKLDNTPNPFVVYHLIQTLQPNDSRYSCAQLKVLAYELEYAMTDIDKSIKKATGKSQALNNQAQTSSQMAQLASALGGKGAPMTAAVSQLDSSMASQAAGNAQQQAASIQQIRDSQQKRHDYLMQIYFQKRCDD